MSEGERATPPVDTPSGDEDDVERGSPVPPPQQQSTVEDSDDDGGTTEAFSDSEDASDAESEEYRPVIEPMKPTPLAKGLLVVLFVLFVVVVVLDVAPNLAPEAVAHVMSHASPIVHSVYLAVAAGTAVAFAAWGITALLGGGPKTKTS